MWILCRVKLEVSYNVKPIKFLIYSTMILVSLKKILSFGLMLKHEIASEVENKLHILNDVVELPYLIEADYLFY